MFEWDESNLQQISAQQIEQEEAEQALRNNPIPVIEQEIEGDLSYLYYGETNSGRLLSLMVLENKEAMRVIMASELNADQRRDYLLRRSRRGPGSAHFSG
jgi:uncharacterized DUF497 family protein